MPQLRIAIIGAGIGGLSLGIALRRKGLAPQVYEQAAQLAEIGAAVALSANATRELERFGCMSALEEVSTEPSELIYRSWGDGRRIADFPVRAGRAYREKFRAPYFGLHRADLQRILSQTHGPEGLNLGFRLTDLEETGEGMRLTFANGRTRRIIPAHPPSVALCPSRIFPLCPIRKLSSSGWGRTRISCITPSAASARL
jgi:salicylate hydroxylase